MQTRIIALTLAATLAVPASAFPCGNSVYLEQDEATRLVAKVERAFRRGQYQKVRKLAESKLHDVRRQHLQRKLLKLVAVAQVRTGAAAEGTVILERLLEHDPSDTYLETRIGEGLARSGHTPRALEILTGLEARDLIADPEGWLTLAQLRANLGDTEGSNKALARCKQQTKKASRCKLQPVQRPQVPDEPTT